MKINKDRFYSWLYDWHFPIMFFVFIFSMMLTGITQNPIYIAIFWPIDLIFTIFCLCYLYISLDSIKLWWKNLFKYKLTKEERELYESILNKDVIGYAEWYEQTKGDDICGHWIKDITEEEVKLIDKIHEHFFSKDWWIAVPISTAQVCAVMLDDIKNKVK